MIQNIDDIYNLISSQTYQKDHEPVMPLKHRKKYPQGTHLFFNRAGNLDYISVKVTSRYIEVYKLANGKSEYYEKIPTTNKTGRQALNRFTELLTQKNLVAMVQHINSL
ncbi:MAG: hypothetical protein J6Y49_00030 [Alphaproteobacteria bacterium]|nr:hypothetical protein [Alphaproteobacteria bacterium]